VILWLIAKPLLQKAKQTEGLERELRKFKNNPAIFNALLAKQKQMPPMPDDLQPIVLGNPNAEHTITMITNPYCGPCAKGHTQLEEALAENPHLKAHIIFAVCHDSDGRKTKVARHLMNLAPTPALLSEAMNAWYEQKTKNYDTWAAQYPTTTDAVPDTMIKVHCAWTETVNITGTPTFFVDGYEVPPVFGLRQSAQLQTQLTQPTDFAK